MKNEEIENDEKIIEFFDIGKLRKTTKDQYLLRLSYYFNFLGKTPTEAIDEADMEELKGLRLKNRSIRKYLIEFKKYLEEEKHFSPNFINHTLSTVKTFYRTFEIELPHLRLAAKDDQIRITTDEIIKRKHIKQALKHVNLKYRAIILLMSSSGMGQAEIRNLTYRDFIKAISKIEETVEYEPFDIDQISKKLSIHKKYVATWKIYRQKTGMPYYTFSTKESIEAIIEYLKKEKKENKAIKSLDDYLFYNRMGKKITNSNICIYFAQLNDKLGFGKSGRLRFFRSHGLRKYFASKLYKAGLEQLTIDWLLAHKINSVTESYFKSDVEKLRRQYESVQSELYIDQNNIRKVERQEYENMQEELREKERRLRVLEEKIDKLAAK